MLPNGSRCFTILFHEAWTVRGIDNLSSSARTSLPVSVLAFLTLAVWNIFIGTERKRERERERERKKLVAPCLKSRKQAKSHGTLLYRYDEKTKVREREREWVNVCEREEKSKHSEILQQRHSDSLLSTDGSLWTMFKAPRLLFARLCDGTSKPLENSARIRNGFPRASFAFVSRRTCCRCAKGRRVFRGFRACKERACRVLSQTKRKTKKKKKKKKTNAKGHLPRHRE